MSEMVERVALAISGSDDPANVLEIHRVRARAAIEAMRKPTEAMKGAGFLAVSVRHPDGCNMPRGTEAEAWSAMIDEALK